MPADRHPLRLLEHALRAGDRRLADLIAVRLYPAALPPALATLAALRRRLGI
jgi:hypothetical protein